MHILLAPDSFKGSLTSVEAAAAMAAGIDSAMPEAEILTMPLADGGEGTLDVLRSVYGGDIHQDALYFSDNGMPCALIESARLIGLSLPEMQADVFDRGSATLGAAMLSALDAGVRDIRIALGGSAVADGGLGLLAALGCRVLNYGNETVSPDLNGMMQAEEIDVTGMDARLAHVRLTILSDVQNALCGRQGAVYIYGRQKGIQACRLPQVEAAMQQWGDLCERAFGVSAMGDVGAGAAGGLGFALELLGAQIVSGAEYVMAACDFDQVVKTVDWVVSGEGKSDAQTLCGKLPMTVADAARKYGVRTVLISGDVDASAPLNRVFDALVSARPPGCPLNQAILQAADLLQQAASGWAESVRSMKV